MAELYAEYQRRNLEVAKAVGINANALTALKRVQKMKRPPRWLVAALEGIIDRSVGLAPELSQWRNLAPDAPDYVHPSGVAVTPKRPGWLSESFGKFLREKGYTDEQIAAECAANGLLPPGVGLVPAPTGKPPEDSYPDQTVLHAEGQCGNCLQATIAGILGWPLDKVPHFALLGEDHWWDCAQAWLDSQGYWIDYKPTSYATEGGILMERCWLSGQSPRGFSHAVIGDPATGTMLHDPHPSRAGLLEVSYTIYFFRKPAHGGQQK